MATSAVATDMSVLTAKDFEDACKQPVAITTLICVLVILPLKTIGMYAFFTKMTHLFNPNQLQADLRRKLFNSRHVNMKK